MAENDQPWPQHDLYVPPDTATLGPPAVSIWRASNGYIVQDGSGVTVCEDVEMDESGEQDAAARLLWTVLDSVGMSGSKHDRYRVRVTVLDQKADAD